MEALKMRENPSGIEVVANRVLIKPDEIEEVTDGGIVIPVSVQIRHGISVCYGTVVSIGPDCFIHSVETTERYIDGAWKPVERKTNAYSRPFVKIGDRVAFSIYSGHEQTGEDGVKYKAMNDIDITAIVTDKVTQTSLEARKPLSSA